MDFVQLGEPEIYGKRGLLSLAVNGQQIQCVQGMSGVLMDSWVCAQLLPTLCNSMDYSPPGFSVHGILHARILELVAISFFRVKIIY